MMQKKAFSLGQTWLQCINCGHKADLLSERKFWCPACDGLFEVRHDFSQLPSFEDLKFLFDSRASMAGIGNSHDPKRRSGVWRFKELIMPFLPDDSIITLGEGNVPIIPAGPHLRDWVGDIDLYIILEGMTPTGSFKDLGGTVMISVAKIIGISAIGCSSTGDTSAMVAAYSAAAGIKSYVIIPEGKVTAVQFAQPLIHGAKVIILPGSFDDCMKVEEALVREFGAFPANSLNPTRIEGHQATVFLIAQHFGWKLPNWIALPVGNGSNCSSVGKALRLLSELSGGKMRGTRILGCQSRAADPLAESWRALMGDNYSGEYYTGFGEAWQEKFRPKKVGETTATAARIGDPVSRVKVMREIISSGGAMQTAEENELNEAVAVCGMDGYFVCPQTGIALAGLRGAVREGWIKKGETVVVVSTASGLKFTESAVKDSVKNVISLKDCKPETTAKALGLA